jgi:hypothetical protein
MEKGVVLKQQALRAILLAAVMLLSASLSYSNPLSQWQSWILDNHQQHACPWQIDQSNSKGTNKACIWPGKLDLSADARSGAFLYSVDVFEQQAFVALPGDINHWPSSISVNGKAAAVIERNQLPHIALSAGRYTISGVFKWRSRPAQLTIPEDVAIMSLLLDGKSREVDRRNGRLILSSQSAAPQTKTHDSLSIEVFRLLKDGVPVTLETQITLSVSGKPREVSFGSVLLANSEVVAIQSPIPARIEADNSMRAQVVAGEHTLRVYSRFVSSPTAITTHKTSKEWPQFEFISFQSATEIRQLALSGPVSIDTSQIAIPRGWQGYPTYRMGDKETLNITTEFRGDHSPAANELHVKRNIWLDFDGDGITTLDNISGNMYQHWRLNAAPDTKIGRATVDGEPVLITLDDNQQGIEVRSPNIELQAVTRTEATSGFSASGWNARADHYSATLHLPPGWRVLHASGVDNIWGSWLSQWDLWDVFLVLIMISATRKLLGNAAAVLAGGAFLIALHEPSTPLLIMPLLLVVVALLPIISGKIHASLRSIGVMLAAALALSVIAFAVSTFRLAIYPSLERAQIGTYSESHYNETYQQISSAPMLQMADRVRKGVSEKDMRMEEVMVTAQMQSQKQDLYQVTENDRVQTGPGLPTWTWNSVQFNATGPVAATETLAIYYSSPWMTSLWRVLAVLLVAWYAAIVIARLARVCRFKTGEAANKPASSTGTPTATTTVLGIGLIFSLGLFNSPPSMAQDSEPSYPPKYLLDELEQRLTKAPDCLPNCVSLNDGKITVRGTAISIEFYAYADADIALPLPGGYESWALDSLTSDNAQLLPLRKQQDKLYARLAKGHHRLKLKGNITADVATINFPLPIHNMVVSAPNWVVEGLVNGRVTNNTLTLRAGSKSTTEKADTLKADPAASFVEVKRHFVFGKKWHIETTVQRIAPLQGAISIPVALIANEKPLKDMGAITNGEILLQLGHKQPSVSWSSTLEAVEQLSLKASSSNSYIEQWSFTPSSLWRLSYEGLPPIKASSHANAFEPVFKPWPAETLLVDVRKPGGVPGPIHTVESALLNVDASSKLQRSTLTLQIRSSLGTNYRLALPEQTEVLKFSINGQTMNTPAANEVIIPLRPGEQSVMIEFQSQTEMGLISRSPAVQLEDGATNIQLHYSLPRDRWPLYLSGPAIGPAMLFWGVLCVIVLGALLLPRVAKATNLAMPITLGDWLLLGLGLSTVNSYGVLIIAVMFFILAARKQRVTPDSMTRFTFNTMQFAIVCWVMIAALTMIAAIPMGLLSNPQMQVVGNGSSSHFYNYYQDIAGEAGFPVVTVVSLPMLAYRAVMLLWSLWLSTRLLQWAGWAWGCFVEHGGWRGKVVGVEKL